MKDLTVKTKGMDTYTQRHGGYSKEAGHLHQMRWALYCKRCVLYIIIKQVNILTLNVKVIRKELKFPLPKETKPKLLW